MPILEESTEREFIIINYEDTTYKLYIPKWCTKKCKIQKNMHNHNYNSNYKLTYCLEINCKNKKLQTKSYV